MAGPGRLLSVRELAQRLGVSTATLYRRCDEGGIAHLRIGNVLRVRSQDLEDFIHQGRR